eukprot:Em0011g1197a
MMGPLTTSGSTSSKTLTLSSPVLLSYAGLYVCNASANGMSRTASYAFNVSVSAQANVINTMRAPPAGSQLEISCSVSGGFTTDRPIFFMWAGPNGAVPSNGRISANNASNGLVFAATYVYTSTLTFSTLSSQDNNTMYQCSVGTLYTPYFTQYSSSPTSNTTIQVNALVLSPTITSTCQQGVLQLNCTADKPLSVVPPLMFSWFRSSVGNGIFSPLDPGLPGINVSRTPSGSNTSTLSIAGSSVSGSYVYLCMAVVAVPDDAPVAANVTSGVMSFSISGVVSGLALQSYGQLSRIVWEVPVVNCNRVSYYTVAMTTYADGTLIETGTTTDQNYTLTKNYTAGVPYKATVWALFGTVAGGNTSQTIFTQELVPTSLQNITVTPINGSTILVSWNPLSPVEARGYVRYYLVTWTPSSSKARGTAGSANLTADATMFLITGLDPMVSYTISVSTGTSAGVGAASNTTAMTPVLTSVAPSTTAPSVSASGSSSCDTMTCLVPIVVAVPILVLLFIIIISIVLIKISRSKLHADLDQPVVIYSEIGGGTTPPPVEVVSVTSTPVMGQTNQAVSTRDPPHIKDFAAHVNLMHQDRNKMFDREFQSIPECQHPTETAALPCNKGKNRFHNISPYDYNRVLLQKMEGVEGSDYINASVIDVNYDGYKKTHAYIMAQGPMPNTVGDFWRMIFENKLDTIVMLTQCNEGGKRKCEQYWSDNVGETIEPFPGLRVTLKEATMFADYVTRKMTVELAGSAPLTVSHYQYEGWPDTGVPSSATSFIGFIRRVRSDNKQDGRPPMVVHCSSGVGRSGVFIILDSMLEQLKVKDTVNVCECFADMRRQRSYTIETLEQYMFIHDALNELITCGVTHIEASELRVRTNELHRLRLDHSGFDEQFELLEKVSYKPTERDILEAKQAYNIEKNRYADRLPYNISRARLRPTGVQGAEYINASCIDGYKVRNAYIAAQAPLQNTVEDFWRMVWEFKSLNIVMLCRLDEDRVVQYWPMRSGETLVYGKMAVTLIGNPDVSSKDQITVYKLELKEEKTPAQGNTVNLFHYTGWPENGRPSENGPVIKMNKALLKAQMQAGNKCTTVVCNDGMGRTGAFITIHAMMERLKTEHVVDFFQFIKSSRNHRQHFVTIPEQYIFCHEAVTDFAEEMGQYANFKSHRPSDLSSV